jgi:hypothetical protein
MATMSAKDLVAEASRNIETLSGADAAKLVSDPNVMFVDIRESDELQKTGTLKGALHVPRGLLEFQAGTQRRQKAGALLRLRRPVCVGSQGSDGNGHDKRRARGRWLSRTSTRRCPPRGG